MTSSREEQSRRRDPSWLRGVARWAFADVAAKMGVRGAELVLCPGAEASTNLWSKRVTLGGDVLRLPERQVTAVIAHELGHLKHRATQAACHVLGVTAAAAAARGFHAAGGPWLVGALAQWAVWWCLFLFVQRRAEYWADDAAVDAVGSAGLVEVLGPATDDLFSVDPPTSPWRRARFWAWWWLYAAHVHPSEAARVRRVLRRCAGRVVAGAQGAASRKAPPGA